ncbi:MAG: hypothetical protein ABIQ47_06950 [Tepidiformaceae bacterium]
MNRQQQITTLMGRTADDERRLALDELDKVARDTNTFGSKEHRAARDKVEKTHDDARRSFEGFSDDQLEAAVAQPAT